MTCRGLAPSGPQDLFLGLQNTFKPCGNQCQLGMLLTCFSQQKMLCWALAQHPRIAQVQQSLKQSQGFVNRI